MLPCVSYVKYPSFSKSISFVSAKNFPSKLSVTLSRAKVQRSSGDAILYGSCFVPLPDSVSAAKTQVLSITSTAANENAFFIIFTVILSSVTVIISYKKCIYNKSALYHILCIIYYTISVCRCQYFFCKKRRNVLFIPCLSKMSSICA